MPQNDFRFDPSLKRPQKGAPSLGPIFPELHPPIDEGRSYPKWLDDTAPSALHRFALGVVALLTRRKAAAAPLAAVNDRNKTKRGSGSW